MQSMPPNINTKHKSTQLIKALPVCWAYKYLSHRQSRREINLLRPKRNWTLWLLCSEPVWTDLLTVRASPSSPPATELHWILPLKRCSKRQLLQGQPLSWIAKGHTWGKQPRTKAAMLKASWDTSLFHKAIKKFPVVWIFSELSVPEFLAWVIFFSSG